MEARRAHVESMERKMREMQGGVDADQALAMGAHTVGQRLLCWRRSGPCMQLLFLPPPPPPLSQVEMLALGVVVGVGRARARAEARHGYAQQVSCRRPLFAILGWQTDKAWTRTRTLDRSWHKAK
jgi:hypothetical protein